MSIKQIETYINDEAAANEIYGFQVHETDTQNTIRATEAPHEGVVLPTASPDASLFTQLEMAANFYEQSPGAADYLQSRGYGVERERQADGGSIIDAACPKQATETIGQSGLSFEYVGGGIYTSRDFFSNLREGRVILSQDDEDPHFQLHDTMFHAPMWELAGTVPELADAFQAKAGRILDQLDALPPKQADEPQDLAWQRIMAENHASHAMAAVDFQMSLGASIAAGIKVNSPDETGVLLVEHGLREIFSHTEHPLSRHNEAHDTEVTDEDISAWAQALLKQVG